MRSPALRVKESSISRCGHQGQAPCGRRYAPLDCPIVLCCGIAIALARQRGGGAPRGSDAALCRCCSLSAVYVCGGVCMGLCVAVVGSRSLAGSWACCPLALGRWLPAPSLPGLSLVSGGAAGVDTAAAAWAARWGVPCVVLRPEWGLLGRAAGLARNQAIARRADAAVVVLDCRAGVPVSRGALDVLARLERAGVPCRVVRVLS